jgi:hypothetical protein
MDPRVEAAGTTREDLDELFALSLQVRDLSGEASQAAARVAAALRSASGEARTELQAIQSALVTDRGYAYPQPMLADQIRYLYSMLSRADQRPGADAYERYAQLRAELDRLVGRLERVTGQQ